MSKRQTTGLPKKKRKGDDEANEQSGGLFSRYIRQDNQEEDIQRLVLIGIGAIIGILAIAILAAILWEQVIIPSRPVAVVNGDPISVSEFQERVRLERVILIQRLNNDLGEIVRLGLDPNQLVQQDPHATWWQEISGQPELLGGRVLDDMIQEQLVREQAAELGITVDEATVEDQIEAFFNFIGRDAEDPEAAEDPTATPVPSATPTPFVSPTPSPSPQPTATPSPTAEVTEEAAAVEETTDATPTLTPVPSSTPTSTPTFEEEEAQFNELVTTFYNRAQREANLDEATIRSYFEYQALLQQLEEAVTEDLSRETTYVNARHILVDTEEEAQDLLTALEEGESFADLARAASTGPSGSQGGELDWAPASNYVPEFETAALEAEIGAIVGPVQTEFGFHVIQVRAREEREMSDNEYNQAKTRAFNEWLEENTGEETNEIDRRDNWPNFVPVNPPWVYRPTGIDLETTQQ